MGATAPSPSPLDPPLVEDTSKFCVSANAAWLHYKEDKQTCFGAIGVANVAEVASSLQATLPGVGPRVHLTEACRGQLRIEIEFLSLNDGSTAVMRRRQLSNSPEGYG